MVHVADFNVDNQVSPRRAIRLASDQRCVENMNNMKTKALWGESTSQNLTHDKSVARRRGAGCGGGCDT